jgi:hypothetical protein
MLGEQLHLKHAQHTEILHQQCMCTRCTRAGDVTNCRDIVADCNLAKGPGDVYIKCADLEGEEGEEAEDASSGEQDMQGGMQYVSAGSHGAQQARAGAADAAGRPLDGSPSNGYDAFAAGSVPSVCMCRSKLT